MRYWLGVGALLLAGCATEQPPAYLYQMTPGDRLSVADLTQAEAAMNAACEKSTLWRAEQSRIGSTPSSSAPGNLDPAALQRLDNECHAQQAFYQGLLQTKAETGYVSRIPVAYQLCYPDKTGNDYQPRCRNMPAQY